MKLVIIQTKVDTDCVYDTFTAAMIHAELLRAEGEFCKEKGINRNGGPILFECRIIREWQSYRCWRTVSPYQTKIF